MNNELISGTERQQQIIRLVMQRQRISVTELCDLFSISQATARRDLEMLAAQGKVQRVHGGAILVEQAPPELPLLERGDEQYEEKQRIGKTAAGLVQDGETIFLGSGTTVLELARALRERHNLHVITNSLAVLNVLAGLPDMTVISLGGLLRNSELSFIGHITEQALAEVRADKVFIGVRAISLEQGLTSDYLPETMTDRAILRAGREVIVLADFTKFGRLAAAFLAPVESVHTLVTDKRTPEEVLEGLRQRGVKVVRV